MRPTLLRLCSLLSVCLLSMFAGTALAAPAVNTVIDAEGITQAKTGNDPIAFGKSYVTHSQAWQPLLYSELPTDGDQWDVWVRYRQGPICAKAVQADGQKELKWLWAKPEFWQWTNVGNYDRKTLGNGLVFIRGDKGSATPQIDAIMFVGEKGLHPTKTPNYNEPSLPPVTLTLDWEKTLRPISPMVYGINSFKAFNETVMSNPAYQNNMRYMAPKLIRYHSANLTRKNHTDGWLDYANKGWDRTKIKRALEAFDPGDAQVLMSISSYPEWMKTIEGRLHPDEVDAYVALCAELVNIVNVENKKGFRYWEITNEKDIAYWVKPAAKGKPLHIEALADIVVKAAVAMKAVDPSIKTGGPASARADKIAHQKAFAKAILPQMDFFSYHMYAAGKASDATDYILYERTDTFAEYNKKIKAMIDEISPDRHVETHFNEYNISWTWETRDPRMLTYIGAVFDTLCMIGSVNAGISASNAWNDIDGIYGKMDSNFRLRPGAHVFHLMNTYGHGEQVKADAENNRHIVPLAVKSKAYRTLVLVNRSGLSQMVNSAHGLVPTKAFRIGKHGFKRISPTALTKSTALPGHSVTVFVQEK